MVIIFILGALSCGKNNPAGPLEKVDDFIYPLEIGNHWEYRGIFYRYNITPDSIVSRFSDTTIFSSVVTINRLDTLVDTLILAALDEELYDSTYQNSYSGTNYYKNHDDGLYFYGVDGSTSVTPKYSSEANYYLEMSLLGFSFLAKMSGLKSQTYIENPPLKSLDYNFTQDNQWFFRTEPSYFTIEKRIAGFEKIKLLKRSFDCVVVEWILPTSNSIRYDYIAKEGLIKMVTISRNIRIYDYNSVDLGRCDIYHEYILTKID